MKETIEKNNMSSEMKRLLKEHEGNYNISREMKRLLKEHEGNYDSIISQLENILSVYDDLGYGLNRDEIFDVLEILGEPYC